MPLYSNDIYHAREKMKLELDEAKKFTQQTQASLQSYCQTLEKLMSNASSKKHVNAALKSIQAVKGSASFLELHNIEVLAQANINLLTKVRDQKIQYSDNVIKLLATAIKAILDQLKQIEKNCKESGKNYDSILDKFNQVASGADDVNVRLSENKLKEILNFYAAEAETVAVPAAVDTSVAPAPIKAEAAPEVPVETEQLATEQTQASEEKSVPNTSDYEHIQVDGETIKIHLQDKVSLDKLVKIHEEILANNVEDKKFEVHTEGLEKPSTSLLQFLFCLSKKAKHQGISFPNPSDALKANSQLIFSTNNFI